MIVKRLASVALALALISGAWYLRDRVIDGPPAPDKPANSGVLVCASELVEVCRAVVGSGFDDVFVVTSEPANATLDRLAIDATEPVLWLTFDGFPQMIDSRRNAAALTPIDYSTDELASSRLAAIVRRASTSEVVDACGDPVDLGCVGELTELTPAVSSIDSGLGLLCISAAFASRADDALSFDDLELLSWARSFRRESDKVELSGGTAVATIQTRTSVSVAIGVEAELSPAQRDRFDVLYAEPMARATVVLLRPAGFDVPAELLASLGDALLAQGWDAPQPAALAGALPSPETMIAIREFWSGLK
jgi:hypothetical protein